MDVVCLRGRLTKDPVIRKSQKGNLTASFTLAVERYFGGDRKTEFIPCFTYGKKAEVLDKYVTKGDRLGIVGELTTNRYTKDGVEVTGFNVIANTVDLIETKKDKENARANQGYSQQVNNAYSYQQAGEYDTGFAIDESVFEVDDDDFPF